MTRALLLSCLFASACFHSTAWQGGHGTKSGMHPMSMMMGDREEKEIPWPTVRIDEPAGATFVMEAGVFGDGLQATAPLQGQFQPTAAVAKAGYPIEVQLDASAAHRYGSPKALTLYARLNITATKQRHGILLIAPSECELRALVAGDLDEVRVSAEVLPTAVEACRPTTSHGEPGASCPGMMHGGAGMMHGGAQPGCPMHGGALQGGHGAMHGGCGGHGGHGNGHGMCGMFGTPQPGAVLTLRMTKF